MRNIAYIPLDIPKHNLQNAVDKYNFWPHHLYPDAWDCLPVCGKTKKWSQSEFYKAYERRYESGEVKWNVPELKPILEYYPGEVTHAQVLNQKASIVAHKDTPILRKQPEPNGFKILLNNVLEKSFYVKVKGKRMHIKLPETTNCFAINEHDILHGATMPKNKKYIVSCFGIIDETKHKNLITRSIKKYGDYAIYF
tara:strand:- start:4142 stop:4729 length:588 start_codon:yes stop_codon:yes gene_type:complete